MKPKKPRKPEVVEVRFRLLTDRTNARVRSEAAYWTDLMCQLLYAKLVRKPTVERVGKR